MVLSSFTLRLKFFTVELPSLWDEQALYLESVNKFNY